MDVSTIVGAAVWAVVTTAGVLLTRAAPAVAHELMRGRQERQTLREKATQERLTMELREQLERSRVEWGEKRREERREKARAIRPFWTPAVSRGGPHNLVNRW